MNDRERILLLMCDRSVRSSLSVAELLGINAYRVGDHFRSLRDDGYLEIIATMPGRWKLHRITPDGMQAAFDAKVQARPRRNVHCEPVPEGYIHRTS